MLSIEPYLPDQCHKAGEQRQPEVGGASCRALLGSHLWYGG